VPAPFGPIPEPTNRLTSEKENQSIVAFHIQYFPACPKTLTKNVPARAVLA
jgi:hypothetical protein